MQNVFFTRYPNSTKELARIKFQMLLYIWRAFGYPAGTMFFWSGRGVRESVKDTQ